MTYEGIIPLYKPRGMTSFDCIFKLRKILGMKKIGHTGTLDPEVDGVLPLCLGRATKVAEFMTEADKIYQGEVTIGYSTTTEDQTGEIVAEKAVIEEIEVDRILEVLKDLTGSFEQTPPIYSAVKVRGKRLYEYAREGIQVERPVRQITVYDFSLESDDIIYQDELARFSFRVNCSKGTYVRTLAVMIGEKLGYPAHMSKLTRVDSASIKLEDCLSLEDIQLAHQESRLEERLLPLEIGLINLPKYTINDNLAEKVKNGAVLPLPEEYESLSGPLVLQNKSLVAIAIYMQHPNKAGLMKPQKVIRNDF